MSVRLWVQMNRVGVNTPYRALQAAFNKKLEGPQEVP